MKKNFILLPLMICFLLCSCTKTHKTIEEITGVEFDKISYIKTGENQAQYYDVEEFINEYQNLEYKKITGEYGNTTHMYFICYDADDKILFTLVNVGNQDKVFIKKGSFDINSDAKENLYQLIK